MPLQLNKSLVWQSGIVAITTIIGVFASKEINYSGGLNALWIVGIPVAVAMLCNRNVEARLAGAVALVALSWLVLIGGASVVGHPI